MVENGVDPAAVRKNGYSAAHLAAASGRLETLKYLMSQNVSIDQVGQYVHNCIPQSFWEI